MLQMFCKALRLHCQHRSATTECLHGCEPYGFHCACGDASITSSQAQRHLLTYNELPIAMETILLPMEFLQVLHHRSRANEGQYNIGWRSVQCIHQELYILLCRNPADVCHQERALYTEGQLFALLLHFGLWQVDSEGIAIHHWTPYARHNSVICDTCVPQHSSSLLGDCEEVSSRSSPIPVAPIHACHGNASVNPANCSASQQGRETCI
mmetsp:Transcript_28009/g.64642  ORF Transcript_28009/g.64642 Transcript_28009/m.64642 type:complete len:210 (-) Transcript_28009:511-1140(-)